MKEHFEDRKLTGPVNVTCKFEDGTIRMWTQRKEEVVANIVEIVGRYKAMGLSLTLRQLHYQMVAKNPKYVNHQTAYKKLGTILDDCRYSGLVDWDAIVDRGRVPYLPWYAESVDEALETIYRQYRRDRMDGQDNVVELWTEKDALSDIFRRPTSKYHVRLVVNKGYTSSSAIYDAYERVIDAYNDDRKFVILYFGDHDPSGLDMVRDIEERLYFMMQSGDNKIDYPEEWLTIEHIGLTIEQVRQYNLPPNPAKMTDTRADAYIAKFGATCWEVDALEPTVLIALVETHISDHIDMDKYQSMLEKEKVDKAKFRSIMDNKPDEDEDLDEED
jgi:hypothetical protein